MRSYIRKCPSCGASIEYKTKNARHCYWLANRNHTECNSCKYKNRKLGLTIAGRQALSKLHKGKQHRLGHKTSEYTKQLLRDINIARYTNELEHSKTSESVKKAMHNPLVREKHIKGMLATPWLKVRCDEGQLALLDKWSRLGFKFEANYQVSTTEHLFYLDGYDKERNVVFEYDSAYHKNITQMRKDKQREQVIIAILNPKAFWRYDSVTGRFDNIVRKEEVSQ